MKHLKKKEMKEIGLILGSVLLVAFVGTILHLVQERKMEAIAGAAVQLDPNLPTYSGVLTVLKDNCQVSSGSGSCNSICGVEKVCLPVENDCDQSNTNNNCLCCSWPK